MMLIKDTFLEAYQLITWLMNLTFVVVVVVVFLTHAVQHNLFTSCGKST